MRLVLTRDVTRKECPWLEYDLYKGEIVTRYAGHTYGCITDNGIAIQEGLGSGPFLEVPKDAVKEL